MNAVVKVRFNASSSRMEAFGNGKYIVYLLSSENDTDAMSEIKAHLSKQLGVPAENIQFKSRDGAGNYIFET